MNIIGYMLIGFACAYFFGLLLKYKSYEMLYKNQIKKDVLSDLEYATTEQILEEIKKRPINAVIINVEFDKLGKEDDIKVVLDSINLSREEVSKFLKFSINLVEQN